MTRQRSIFTLAFLLSCTILPAHGFAAQDRAEVEVRVRADVVQDLAEELQLGEWISGRVCLDGRAAENFPDEVAEFWVNLEWCAV